MVVELGSKKRVEMLPCQSRCPPLDVYINVNLQNEQNSTTGTPPLPASNSTN